MTETITWHPASEPPDADTMVLICIPDSDEPVWSGHYDGATYIESQGFPVTGVKHWAHMPEGPKP